MTEQTMWRGITKREFLATQVYEATRNTYAADGVLTESEEQVAEDWNEYAADHCPFCLGTGEVRTARGLYESPAEALVRCPWCESHQEREPVTEPPPF